MRWVVAVVMAGLVAGCATPWVNPNVTAEQAARDQYECQRDAAQMAGLWGGNPLIGYSTGADCLKSRGYRRQP